MAIKLTNEGGQRMVGVAYADACMRKLGVSEFVDDDQFSNLEVSVPLSQTDRHHMMSQTSHVSWHMSYRQRVLSNTLPPY